MLKDQWLKRISDIVGSKYVLTELDHLQTVAVDETPNLKPHLPEAWVRPGNEEEVAQVMQLAYANGIPVTPRGAGTGQGLHRRHRRRGHRQRL